MAGRAANDQFHSRLFNDITFVFFLVVILFLFSSLLLS